MLKYAIIEVDEVIKLKCGKALNDNNLIQYEIAQVPPNNSTSDALDNVFDTLEDARAEMHKYKADGRVDKNGEYYSVNITSYQLTEIEVECGQILEWGDIWDITPFEISIDKMGNVSERWGNE